MDIIFKADSKLGKAQAKREAAIAEAKKPKFNNPEIWVRVALKVAKKRVVRLDLKLENDGSFTYIYEGKMRSVGFSDTLDEIAIRLLDGEKSMESENWGFWRMNDIEIEIHKNFKQLANEIIPLLKTIN